MLRVDTQKLKGSIIEKGFKMETFAESVGVSVPTLRKYLREPETIPYWFIQESVRTLNLSVSQAKAIFFAS